MKSLKQCGSHQGRRKGGAAMPHHNCCCRSESLSVSKTYVYSVSRPVLLKQILRGLQSIKTKLLTYVCSYNSFVGNRPKIINQIIKGGMKFFTKAVFPRLNLNLPTRVRATIPSPRGSLIRDLFALPSHHQVYLALALCGKDNERIAL